MATYYICRHGNTFDPRDTVTRVGARTDLHLSHSGIEQAKALAEFFSGHTFASAFASPLMRTRQTAQAILAGHYQSPPLLIAPFLTEIDYGPDENKPEADVVARLGADAIEKWDDSAYPPDGWIVDPPALIAAWRDFLLRGASTDETILVVTSNGIARFILDVAVSIPDGAPRKLKTGAYGIVTVGAEASIVIEDWNIRP